MTLALKKCLHLILGLYCQFQLLAPLQWDVNRLLRRVGGRERPFKCGGGETGTGSVVLRSFSPTLARLPNSFFPLHH